MSTLSRVEQPKSCDHVGWQTYGRIVKGISWASGWIDVWRMLTFSALAFLRGPSLKQAPNFTKKIRRVPPVSAHKLGPNLGEGSRRNAKALKCSNVSGF